MKVWKLYCDKINSGLELSSFERAHLNRFKARFDLAKKFEKVELSNTSRKTANGYSSILSVFLAYNAAEKLGKSNSFKIINDWEMTDRKLSRALRSMLVKLNEVSDEFLDSPFAIKQLDTFMKGENDNLRIPATVIRHGFAHGSLTPNIMKATTQKNQKSLFELSKSLLDESERLFSNWVNSL